ncbi:MAG: hypothetical protein Q4D02_00075 [Clostridia bacterium]|nr:hypothetical protein [Clostridia bacterium]
MIIVIESIVLCILFTIMVYVMSRNPIATLYNYPPKIQERVKSLNEYKDKIPTTQNKIITKVIASIFIIMIISLILRYINGYTTFIKGFRYSFLIWTIVNIYDALVIDICWFCHSKKFILNGTEDMTKEYHNYWFHIKESLKGELIALIVCAIVGLIIQYIL